MPHKDRMMYIKKRVKVLFFFVLSVFFHQPLLFAQQDVAQDSSFLTRAVTTTLPGVWFDEALTRLVANYDLTITYSFFFRGSASSNMVVDGRGLFVRMARTDEPLISIPDNKNVRLTNIVLKDFSPNHLKLGRNATLTFGDNVYIQLAENASPLAYPWLFDGMNCVIDGRGRVLKIQEADSLLVSDAKQLCLKDLKLIGAGSDVTTSRLRCAGSRSQLTFDDVTVFLDPLFNIKQGNLLIKNNVSLRGRGNVLAWTSTGTLTIDSFACLSFEHGTTFSYDSASARRDRLVMTDLSSALRFDNASLCATHTGLILSNGSIFFDNLVTVSSEASNEAEAIVFDNSVKAYMPLGTTFDVRGIVVL